MDGYIPISGRLRWAEKKCRKTHFPTQAAAAITPRDTAKASTQTSAHTHSYTSSLGVHCRLGSLPAGPDRALWGRVQVRIFDYPATQTQFILTNPPTTQKAETKALCDLDPVSTQIQSDVTWLPFFQTAFKHSAEYLHPEQVDKQRDMWTGIQQGRPSGAFSVSAAGECYQPGSGYAAQAELQQPPSPAPWKPAPHSPCDWLLRSLDRHSVLQYR